jgi:hypothetical protein
MKVKKKDFWKRNVKNILIQMNLMYLNILMINLILLNTKKKLSAFCTKNSKKKEKKNGKKAKENPY